MEIQCLINEQQNYIWGNQSIKTDHSTYCNENGKSAALAKMQKKKHDQKFIKIHYTLHGLLAIKIVDMHKCMILALDRKESV